MFHAFTNSPSLVPSMVYSPSPHPSTSPYASDGPIRGEEEQGELQVEDGMEFTGMEFGVEGGGGGGGGMEEDEDDDQMDDMSGEPTLKECSSERGGSEKKRSEKGSTPSQPSHSNTHPQPPPHVHA